MPNTDPLHTILQIMREAPAAQTPAPAAPQPALVVTGSGNVVAAGDVHVHVLPGPAEALKQDTPGADVAAR